MEEQVPNRITPAALVSALFALAITGSRESFAQTLHRHGGVLDEMSVSQAGQLFSTSAHALQTSFKDDLFTLAKLALRATVASSPGTACEQVDQMVQLCLASGQLKHARNVSLSAC